MKIFKGRYSLKSVMDIIWPYFLVIVILLGVFGGGLITNICILSENREKVIQQSFDDISNSVYDRMGTYIKLCDVLASSSGVKEFAEKNTREEMELSISFLQREMTNISSVANVHISNMIIYFPDNGTLVTSNDIYYAQDEVKEKLNKESNGTLSVGILREIPEYNSWSIYYGNDCGWIVRTLYDRRDVIAYLVVAFRCEDLVPMSTENSVILIGNAETCVYSSEPDLPLETYQQIREEIKATRSFSHNNQEYFATVCLSSLVRMEIMVGIPHDIGTADLVRVQRMAVLLGILCLVSIGGISCLLYYRVIRPIRSLSETAIQSVDSGNFREILAITQKNIQSLRRQTEAAEKERRFLIPLGVGEILYRMGKSSAPGPMLRMAARTLALAGILPEQRFFIAGLFHLEDKSQIFDEMQHKVQQVTPYWVLNNVMTDLVFCDRAGVVATADRYYLVLAACLEGEREDQIQSIMQRCLDFYREHYHVTLAATSPVITSGEEKLRDAVTKVMREIDYLDFWHRAAVQPAQVQADGSLSLYFKCMRNLINRLDNRDYTGAYQIYLQIMEACLPDDTEGIQITKYRIYGMIETLIAYIAEEPIHEEKTLKTLNYEQRLYRIDTMKEFRSETEKIFLELMAYSQSVDRNEGGGHRIQEIRQYILEHYQENELSASALTEKFGISGSYLSREFKRVTGHNLLDYIQKLRVERAKQLLRTESVKNAAVQSGFYDAQALARAFKKYEGITPGEYKHILEKEERENLTKK